MIDEAKIAVLEKFRKDLFDAEQMLNNIIKFRRDGKRVKALEQRFRVTVNEIKRNATEVKRITMEKKK